MDNDLISFTQNYSLIYLLEKNLVITPNTKVYIVDVGKPFVKVDNTAPWPPTTLFYRYSTNIHCKTSFMEKLSEKLIHYFLLSEDEK